jgi:hypothetical protein
MATANPSPAALRVLFHCERVFRSTGADGGRAHGAFLARAAGIVGPERTRDAHTWTDGECAQLLGAIEAAAREHGLHIFRDVRCKP